MGKKKGKQQDEGAAEGAPGASSLGDFLDFPSLSGVSDALLEGNEAVAETAHVTPTERQPLSAPALQARTPPERTMEELEARHKKEKRELEGATRAARKAAGKNKAKVEEAEAAAEQALEALRVMHESEVLGLQLRSDEPSRGLLTEEEVPDAAAAPGLAGIKDMLTGARARDASPEAAELRIDASDGNAYPLSSFCEVYGEEEGRRRWEGAARPACRGQGGALPPYLVMGSKKGGFPVSVEKRARGKTVRALCQTRRHLRARGQLLCRRGSSCAEEAALVPKRQLLCRRGGHRAGWRAAAGRMCIMVVIVRSGE